MRITNVSPTCFMLDGYFIDTVAVRRNIRHSSVDTHDKTNFLNTMERMASHLWNSPSLRTNDQYVADITTTLNRLKKAKIFCWDFSKG